MDEPKGVKIGSGGSTFLCLQYLRKKYGDFTTKKVLIIHSGGYSQRFPIASPLGKAFLTFPDGRLMVEKKLESYRKVEEAIENGVVISSSDTLEYFNPKVNLEIDNSSNLVLFGHRSSIEVGEQHGVYVLDKNGQLERVLQKPTREEMRETKAVVEGNRVITDSFYIFRGEFFRTNLLDWADSFSESTEKAEVCCYGDFLRPLGNHPDAEAKAKYIREAMSTNLDLARWRLRFFSLLVCTFGKVKVETVVLPGDDTFFHFGTAKEFSEHISKGSAFQKCISVGNSTIVHSKVSDKHEIPSSSILEYSKIEGDLEIGKNCFVSSIKTTSDVCPKIPPGTTLITIPLINSCFVTVAFETGKNLKEAANEWFGHNFKKPTMLWNAKLFKAEKTSPASLMTTLGSMQDGNLCTQTSEGLMSMSDALTAKDVRKMVDWRQKLRRLSLKSDERASNEGN
ncbi:hypothetical protein L596_018214 [Steinernema carpocapsae]|uniref:GDP-fucose pyrophosphorylase domain-containing protein n=2 Tax=Steinernema carpocapsae TaxID=34508 RepID=A0A4U5N4C8_STECR|nr:hypothetical protein L596_018214 [Steinernema carpocapsae]